MRIGIAQINTRAGDLEATTSRMVALSESAASQGADILVFPMAALTGPLPVRESEQDDFLLDVSEAILRLADGAACPLVVPVVGEVDGDTAPEAVYIADGGVTPLKMTAYARSLGTGEADYDDGPAPDLPEFRVADTRMGVAFTYDDLDDYDDFQFDVDVVLYIAGYGYAADDPGTALGGALSENRFVEDARTTGAWIVGVGSLGGYGTSVYTGSSFVLSPSGELAASLPAFEEGLVVTEVGPDRAAGLDTPLTPEVYNRSLYLWQTLVLGLHDYLDKQGVRQAVLALDGTVGSMVVAALATDALGPTNVHAIVDVPWDVGREAACQRLARNLRIDVRESSDMRAAAGVTDPADATLRRGIVEAYLSAWAEEEGAMVLSCVDKTGLALGEKRMVPSADTLKPVGDVYRSDILELMRMRNTISPVFPVTTLSNAEAPSLGVSRGGRSNEAWVEAIDAILADHIEWERSVTEVAMGSGHDPVLAQAVLGRLEDSEPYRIGRGLYLMVSTTTLFDARRPLGLAWHNHVRTYGEGELESTVSRLLERVAGEVGDRLRAGDGDASPSPARDGDDAGRSPDQSASREVRDALSYLRDFSLGGGFRPRDFGEGEQGDAGRGGFEDSSGKSWPNPFSEN